MDEQNAVRGQSFTLMVFAGLVALCSVFFILGMVVGRSQSALPVDEGEGVSAAQPADEEGEPELEFYDALSEDTRPEATPPPPAPQPVTPPPQPPARTAAPEPTLAPDPPVVDAGAIMVQAGAFGVEATAQRMVADLREQGFEAFVLRPGGTPALHRVQLGPYTSEEEAARVRARLEAAGFDSVIVR